MGQSFPLRKKTRCPAALVGSPDQIRTGVSGLKGRIGAQPQQTAYQEKRRLTCGFTLSVVRVITHHYPLFLSLVRDR